MQHVHMNITLLSHATPYPPAVDSARVRRVSWWDFFSRRNRFETVAFYAVRFRDRYMGKERGIDRIIIIVLILFPTPLSIGNYSSASTFLIIWSKNIDNRRWTHSWLGLETAILPRYSGHRLWDSRIEVLVVYSYETQNYPEQPGRVQKKVADKNFDQKPF